MERPITRKAIEADPQGFESSADGLLKTGNSGGDSLLDFSDSEDMDRLPSLDEGDGDGETFPKYSLDDFPISEPSTAAPEGVSSNGSGPGESAASRWASLPGLGFLCQPRVRKTCLVVLSVIVIASGVGVTVRHYRAAPSAPKADCAINKTLKRSITVPDYQERMELIVIVGGEQDKRLVAMQLDFGFHAENAYKDFQSDIVRFRDLSYQFVSREQPAKNTQRGWQEVIEKKLAGYLKANHPKSGLQSIRIAHWERL